MKKILLFLLLIMLSGCSLFRSVINVEAPEISFHDFHINGLSHEGVEMLFGFEVTNPNNQGVRAENYRYEFFINDESLLSGERSEQFELHARGSQIIQVPLSLSFQQLYRAGQAVANRDSLQYQLETEVEFNLPAVGSRRVPVRAEGYLPVVRMPQVDFDGIEVKNFGFSGVELEVRIRVINPNSFGFSFDNVGYKLEVNQSEWVDSELEDRMRVSAKSDSIISIPFSLSGASFGSAVLQILQGNQSFNYNISGSGEINVDLPYVRDTAFLPFEFSGQHRLNN